MGSIHNCAPAAVGGSAWRQASDLDQRQESRLKGVCTDVLYVYDRMGCNVTFRNGISITKYGPNNRN